MVNADFAKIIMHKKGPRAKTCGPNSLRGLQI